MKALSTYQEVIKDIEMRKLIYDAWFAHLDADQVDPLDHDGADKYPIYYHYMKHVIGLKLQPIQEVMVVDEVSRRYTRSMVPNSYIQTSEDYGLLHQVSKGYASWEAVMFGILACSKLFGSYGIDSNAFLRALNIHLIVGMLRYTTKPGGIEEIMELLKQGNSIEDISRKTAYSIAHILASIHYHSNIALVV